MKKMIVESNKILKEDPNNKEIIFHRLKAYSYFNEREEMFEDLNKLIELKYFDNKGDRENFYKDKDKNFDNFREDEDFIKFVKELKEKY
jgi:hypothetical protein